MMILLIYLFVFLEGIIIFNLVSTALVESWRNWQSKQIIRVSSKLDDSFIFVEREKIVFLTFSPLIFAGAGFLLIHNIIGLAIGLIIGFIFPGMLINIAKQNRLRKLQSQLVDALMVLSSSLKGGLSFIQALEVVCEEMPTPVSEEFGLIIKRNKLGVNLDDCLLALRERVPLEEINLLVSSIIIAKGTGGELTRVFSRLVETIRNNIKLKQKISTLTLQGRLQGIIMAIMPIVFAAFIYKQNPQHFDVMLETPLGRNLLVLAVVAQIIGMYLIKRISTMKI